MGTARAEFVLRKYDLVVEPVSADSVQYDYDPARPESVLSQLGSTMRCSRQQGERT
jgi:hypothetical protein